MRRGLFVSCLLAAFSLFAEEAPAPAPAAPAPPAPPAARLVPSGQFSVRDGKTALSVALDTDLPVQSVVQIYLWRHQASTTGVPSMKLVESKRFLLDAKRPAPLEILLSSELPPGRYQAEVSFDSQSQYPAVKAKFQGAGVLKAPLELSVGSGEEIALEAEWGESRVEGALRRLDEIRGTLAKGGASTEVSCRRLGWLSERLGKVGASNPVQQIWFPASEAAIKQVCDGLLAGAGAAESLPGALEEAARVRPDLDRLYAQELTQKTMQDLQHWLVFVHQEYWLNKTYGRLTPEQWKAFRDEKLARLDEMLAHYTAYADPKDPCRSAIAAQCPSLVPDCVDTLRKLQGSYDRDLEKQLSKPGITSQQLTHTAQILFQKAGLGDPRH